MCSIQSSLCSWKQIGPLGKSQKDLSSNPASLLLCLTSLSLSLLIREMGGNTASLLAWTAGGIGAGGDGSDPTGPSPGLPCPALPWDHHELQVPSPPLLPLLPTTPSFVSALDVSGGMKGGVRRTAPVSCSMPQFPESVAQALGTSRDEELTTPLD